MPRRPCSRIESTAGLSVVVACHGIIAVDRVGLILKKLIKRLFDDNGSFLELWDEAREAAACFPVPLHETNGDAAQARPPPLARHLGIGGHGPRIAEKLSLLAETQVLAVERAQSSQRDGSSSARVEKIQDTVLPDLFFGDLRAGAGAATAKTIEFCRERGVQTFSMRYIGGQGGKEAWRGATAAADYEHEDVSSFSVWEMISATRLGG